MATLQFGWVEKSRMISVIVFWASELPVELIYFFSLREADFNPTFPDSLL